MVKLRHGAGVDALAVVDGQLVSGNWAAPPLRLWDLTAVAGAASLTGLAHGLAALPDGRLASGSNDDDDVIRLWALTAPGTAEDATAAALAARCVVAEPVS